MWKQHHPYFLMEETALARPDQWDGCFSKLTRTGDLTPRPGVFLLSLAPDGIFHSIVPPFAIRERMGGVEIEIWRGKQSKSGFT